MLAIINAELVMRDHLIPEAVLFVEDGKIAGFGEMRTTPIPEGCEIIDAKGLYVGPGLVDIHCHSGTGVRFIHEPLRSIWSLVPPPFLPPPPPGALCPTIWSGSPASARP